jgi:hypothetical protein
MNIIIGANRVGLGGAKPPLIPSKPPQYILILKFNVPINNQNVVFDCSL